MSPRMRAPARDAEDLANAPFRNDAGRTESEWLLVSDRDPNAPPPSQRIARDYEHLEDLLGSLPVGPPDESWHDEVLKAASSLATSRLPLRRRPVFKWAFGGALLAAASFTAILLLPRPAELQVSIRHGNNNYANEAKLLKEPIRHGNEARAAGETVVGDRLVVEARPKDGAGDLRVFQANGTPVAKCPKGPGCRVTTGEHYVIDLTLEKPVQYQVILVVGDGAVVSRLPDGPMSAYLKAANAADVRIVMHRPIDVH